MKKEVIKIMKVFKVIIEPIIISILLIFNIQVSFKVYEQNKKIKEQENKIQQQIELIDALQQGEEN